ncbi:S24 family peptidase [Sandaracinobacteroides saxicola]|nr:S24 family peptidase [Sandaracinobacteroides saxicola]
MIRDRGSDYASLSRIIGRNPAYIQQFIKRGVPRRLSELDRKRLAQHFGIPESQLGAPESAPARPPAESLLPSSISYPSPQSALAIPFLDVGASAGDGTDPDSEKHTAALLFEPRYARTLASANPTALSAITVTGDSMFPTLSDGDQIIVDTADSARLRDGIYVIRVDGALLVKRLSLHPATRRLSIRSDNSSYPSYDNVDPADVEIIGRVRWVGRTLT